MPAAFAREIRDRDELVPGRQQSAEFALRQLEQQRRHRLGELLHVGERDRRYRRCERHQMQAVQARDAVAFVQREVVGRMCGERAQAVAIGDDAQRDLLRHRAAGHEHRGVLAEQRAMRASNALSRVPAP